MTHGSSLLRRVRHKPYRLLILWLAVAGLLGAALVGVRLFVVWPAQDRLAQAEAAWMAARQRVVHRLEAQEAWKNLAPMLKTLPAPRDFAQLPLAISEVARRDRVAMPDIAYTLEKPQAGGFSKAALKGLVSGRYEDLRRFIHHLEAADGFLFIEDLDVSRHGAKKGEAVAFRITLSTYIREGPAQRVSARAESP